MAQLDLYAALAAREDALARAREGAGEGWMRDALEAVGRLARERREFTTDEVWQAVEAPAEPRAMGAVMCEAARRGLAEATDRTRRSCRVACHARPVRVWRSLVYRERGCGDGEAGEAKAEQVQRDADAG
jgi:hypothetical protein